jgi:transposase
MGYSNDLRVRVIQVVEGDAAARATARQFVIGDSTAIRRAKRWRESSFEAKTNKGQSRSPLKLHEEWLLALVKQEPDLTLEEIQRRLLEQRQQKAGIGSVWRSFDRHGISLAFVAGLRAKSAHGTVRHRWPNERRCLPRLCRTSPGTDPQARRHCRDGQCLPK